jgi:hypothetical protein
MARFELFPEGVQLKAKNNNPKSYLYRPIRTKPTIHFFLQQLLLLSNDVAENPGPDNKVGDLTVFHWIARSVRNKIEYLERICLGSTYCHSVGSHIIIHCPIQYIF